MSVQAIGKVVGLRGLAPSEKLLLLVLANYANPETDECFPSQKRLAADTGLTDRTVRATFKSLEEKGLLVRVNRRRGDGSRSTDMITLRLEQAETISGGAEIGDTHKRKQLPGGAETVSGHEPESNRQEEPSAPKGAARARGSRRCSADWVPSIEVTNWAISKGITPLEWDAELEKFRDHEFARPYTDWEATFRNWLRRTIKGKQVHERNRDRRASETPDLRRAHTELRRDAWADVVAQRSGAGAGGDCPGGGPGAVVGHLPRRPAFHVTG